MKTLLCFGGSIVYGAVDSQGGWVNRLRLMLEQKSTNKPPLVYSLGVSGDTTNELRKRFLHETQARAKDRESTVIIFGIGGNDAAFITEEQQFVTDVKDFQSNMTFLITQAKQFADHIIVLSLTPVRDEITRNRPGKTKSKLNKYQAPYNHCLERICQDYGVIYLDIYTKLAGYISEDGVHPTDKGHAVVSEQIYRIVNSIGGS